MPLKNELLAPPRHLQNAIMKVLLSPKLRAAPAFPWGRGTPFRALPLLSEEETSTFIYGHTNVPKRQSPRHAL